MKYWILALIIGCSLSVFAQVEPSTPATPEVEKEVKEKKEKKKKKKEDELAVDTSQVIEEEGLKVVLDTNALHLGVEAMQIDERTKLVAYEGVMEMEGSAQAIYERALKWFNNYYPNPKIVLRDVEPAKRKVGGQHAFKLIVEEKKGEYREVGQIRYTLKVWARDGKYRYRMTDMVLTYQRGYPIENWYDKSLGAYETNLKKLEKVHEETNKILYDMHLFMGKMNEKKYNEDDW